MTEADEADEKAAAETKGCRRVCGAAAGPGWAAGRCRTVCALLETAAMTEADEADEKAAAETKGCRRVCGAAAGPGWAAGRFRTACRNQRLPSCLRCCCWPRLGCWTFPYCLQKPKAAVVSAVLLLAQAGLLD